MAELSIRRWLTELGVWTSHPFAFLMVPIYAVLWYIFDPASLDWHSFALLATWFMTLVIQRAGHRDMQALHAKLDELLHAQGSASNQLTKIDEEDAEDIEKHRETARVND